MNTRTRIALRKAPLALCIFAMLIGTTAIASAEDGPENPNWWKNPRVIERLQLSDDQVARIESLVYETNLEMVDLKARLAKSSLELDRQLRSESFDDIEVQQLIDSIADSRCAIERSKLVVRYEIARVLNAQQRDKLRRFLERARELRRDRERRFGPRRR